MFQNKRIQHFDLFEYEDYVPQAYWEKIKDGTLRATAVYDGDPAEDVLVGVSVEGDRGQWLEFVWITMSPEYSDDVIFADFIRYRIRKARKEKNYQGVFAEIPAEEDAGLLMDILKMAGTEVRITKNNVYEFVLEDIKQPQLLEKAAEKVSASRVSELGVADRLAAGRLINEDKRPVPAPEVIDWYEYDGDLSIVCKKNDAITGVFLVSRTENEVVIELAYATDPVMVSPLFGAAYKNARELLDPQTTVLAPVVVSNTQKIIKKLIPAAKKSEFIEAVMWFKKPRIPNLMKKVVIP